MFYYAGNAVLLEKQGSTFTGVYTYGNALLRRNSEYPLYDGHGSERTVTTSNQSISGTINFEAFGQTAGTTGSSDSPYMYAGAWGYRTEGDAGLMHVGARYYDAQVGRFITRDTVLSEHPYLYCEHDAVNLVDPSGHDWHYDIGTGYMYRVWGDDNMYVVPEPGYSGRGRYRNSPGNVWRHNLGPLPPGGYTIGPPRRGPTAYALRLTPDPDNRMYGRGGFWIHGDNRSHTASRGCIILPRSVRKMIWDSGDHRLIVQ